MAVYRVDSEHMQATVTSTQGAIERVRLEVSTLTAGLAALQDTWSGDASVSFQTIVQQWRSTQLLVEEQISGIATALAAAGAGYDGVETDARRMFGA